MLKELLENKTIPLFRVRDAIATLTTLRMASVPPGCATYAAEQQAHERRRGTAMRYLHTMVRVANVDKSLDFYRQQARP